MNPMLRIVAHQVNAMLQIVYNAAAIVEVVIPKGFI